MEWMSANLSRRLTHRVCLCTGLPEVQTEMRLQPIHEKSVRLDSSNATVRLNRPKKERVRLLTFSN